MSESGRPSLSPESQTSWSAAGDGYRPPAAGNAPANGIGIAALVVAGAGIVTALSVIGGVALGLVAIVLGFIGHGRAKRGKADNGGVAIAGIVLGALAIIAGIGCIFVYVGIFRTAGGGDYVDCMTQAGSDSTAQQQCTDRFREHFEKQFGSAEAPPVSESDAAEIPA